MDLFDYKPIKEPASKTAPLADRMRPQNLEEFVGQEHLLGKGKILRRAVEAKEVFSMIFWGPPGSGKTTLAYLLAQGSDSYFASFSAVLSGVKEIKEVITTASEQERFYKKKTILFVDEIHRFNKAQQDAFLPQVEKGKIILIGATTENPSFEVISPLLSRCRVFVLNPLSEKEIETILTRALKDKERGLGGYLIHLSSPVLKHLARHSQGDARSALNALEVSFFIAKPDQQRGRKITLEIAQEALQKKALQYDKEGEEHYNLISAFHKSMRGSDPDATLYWLARMLTAGEDPLYLARRMVRFASEDIGNADPQALQVAISAMQAFHFLGSPEGELALAQAAVYLACALKSNTIYTAYNSVQKEIERSGTLPTPLHIRNAPTKLMKEMEYGKDYKYAHDFPEAYVPQDYLPEKLKGKIYYRPRNRGFEEEIKKRLEEWRKKGKELIKSFPGSQ